MGKATRRGQSPAGPALCLRLQLKGKATRHFRSGGGVVGAVPHPSEDSPQASSALSRGHEMSWAGHSGGPHSGGEPCPLPSSSKRGRRLGPQAAAKHSTAERRQHRRGALSLAHGCSGERAHPSHSLWGSGGSGTSGARPILPQAPDEEYDPVPSSKLWKETHRRAGGLLLMKRPLGDPSLCVRRAGAQGGAWAPGTELFCGEDTPESAHVPL